MDHPRLLLIINFNLDKKGGAWMRRSNWTLKHYAQD
jgi:hypothetical protein